jgi:hypothetical protein
MNQKVGFGEDSIPVFNKQTIIQIFFKKYLKIKFFSMLMEKENTNVECCCVCLLENSDKLFNCKHVTCDDCVKNMREYSMARRVVCPLCRSALKNIELYQPVIQPIQQPINQPIHRAIHPFVGQPIQQPINQPMQHPIHPFVGQPIQNTENCIDTCAGKCMFGILCVTVLPIIVPITLGLSVVFNVVAIPYNIYSLCKKQKIYVHSPFTNQSETTFNIIGAEFTVALTH